MRLQKYMAEAGIGSRRACETYIQEGRVRVNDQIAQIGCVIDPDQDVVCVDGKQIHRQEQRVVILLYKPCGVVCTADDPQNRRTVMDYFVDFPVRLYNVGRLDINSEGLLVMTNDGELAYRMTHPKYEMKKTYYVVCDGELTKEQAQKLRNGVMLDDGITAPAKLEHVRPTKTGHTSFTLQIGEGRNRQVRRMMEAVGHKTLLLRREQIGPLKSEGIASGEWRYATEKELAALDAQLQLNQKSQTGK